MPERCPLGRALLAVALAWSLSCCAGAPPLAELPELASPGSPIHSVSNAGFTPDKAQEPQQDPGVPPEVKALQPDESGDDWIKLTSGEWLRGEITVLRDGTLEFDSDKLDDLSLDWDDVAEVRSSRLHTLLLHGRRTVIGTLHVVGDEIVLGGEQAMRLPRDEMLAIVPGRPTEANRWSGKLSLGYTVRSGNTNQQDATGYVFLQRQTAWTRLDNTYNGVFATINSVETANNHRLQSTFDVFLDERTYLTVPSFELFRDPFQNIALRVTPAAGMGYKVVDLDGFSWEVGGAAAYQMTKYQSVAPGDPAEQRTAAAVFTTGIDWDIATDVEFKGNYKITVPIPDVQTYNHHVAGILSVGLIGSLDLDLQFIWDRVNEPAPDAQGVIPVPNDFRFIVGVGWSF